MDKEFHEIYEKYNSDLYAFILKLCGNETLAKDILQDTMLRAMTNFDQYNGKCNIKTWLCTIAKNIYFDHLRKSENRNISLDSAENAAEDSFEQKITDSDTAIRIHHLLHELDEPYREVLLLRIFAELKFSDIGSVFGKSENWAGVTFYRGKQKLIELMKKEGLL
ncbi:MAG: sigma-70 family RNA polymerase sigma factor [Ruminococcus sp.]|nr:sigma-70 family RNA polymerase sigma factor [Ruminococcus sp.]